MTLQSILNRTERQTDPADLKAAHRLERALRRRRLWDRTSIAPTGTVVLYGPSLGPAKAIAIRADGTMVRA